MSLDATNPDNAAKLSDLVARIRKAKTADAVEMLQAELNEVMKAAHASQPTTTLARRRGRPANPNAKPRNENAVRRVATDLPDEFIPRENLPLPFHTDTHSHILSDEYVQIETDQILVAMEDIGWFPHGGKGTYNLWVQTNSRGVGSKRNPAHARHIVTLRHRDFSTSMMSRGDRFVQAYLQNSHNGTCKLGFNLGIFELICKNGAISQRSGFAVQVKHMNITLEQVIRDFLSLANNATVMVEQASILSGITLSEVQALEFARRALPLRWTDRDTGALIENAPQPSELLPAQFAAQSDNTLWNVFQRVQRNLLQGGYTQPGNTKSGAVKVKAISGLGLTVAVNTGLDNLLAEFVEEEFPTVALPVPADLGSFDNPIDTQTEETA